LAVGDIHGCFKALTSLAAYVPFRDDDLLITLGDYVNRGPDSCAVLDWLIHRQRHGSLVALRGNHELMMLQARDDAEAFRRWIDYGGDATLASYAPFGDGGRLVDIPDGHWSFLERDLRGWFETASHFFVHANTIPTARSQISRISCCIGRRSPTRRLMSQGRSWCAGTRRKRLASRGISATPCASIPGLAARAG
jgi:hypothetical protein